MEERGGVGKLPCFCRGDASFGGFRAGRALVSRSRAHREMRRRRRMLGGCSLPLEAIQNAKWFRTLL